MVKRCQIQSNHLAIFPIIQYYDGIAVYTQLIHFTLHV